MSFAEPKEHNNTTQHHQNHTKCTCNTTTDTIIHKNTQEDLRQGYFFIFLFLFFLFFFVFFCFFLAVDFTITSHKPQPHHTNTLQLHNTTNTTNTTTQDNTTPHNKNKNPCNYFTDTRISHNNIQHHTTTNNNTT